MNPHQTVPHDRDSLSDSLRALAGLIDSGVIPAGQTERLLVIIDAHLDVNQALAARSALDGGRIDPPDRGNFADHRGLTEVVRIRGSIDQARVMFQIPAEGLGHSVPATSNVVTLDDRIKGAIA